MDPVARLLAAERDLHAATVAADVEALDGLLDDAAVYTGPDGRAVSKEQDLQAYRSGALRITSPERALARNRPLWTPVELSSGGNRSGSCRPTRLPMKAVGRGWCRLWVVRPNVRPGSPR